MRRTLLRLLVVLLGSAAVGLGVNAVRQDVNEAGESRRLPLIRPPRATIAAGDQIHLDEAEQLWNAGLAFFLDARQPADYAAGHIAMAYNLPAKQFEEFYPAVAGALTKEAALIVYCDGVECDLSHELTAQLRRLGYANVRILVNGWTIWHEAGLPTSTGDTP